MISGADLSAKLTAAGAPLTERWLRQLAGEGWFPRPKVGKFDEVETLLGLVKYYRQAKTESEATLEAEILRKTTEQADQLALENEKTRGNLIHVDELTQRLGKFISAAKARIYSNQKLEIDEKDKLIGMLAGCLKSVDDAECEPEGDSENPS